jgi:hypothetical protein
MTQLTLRLASTHDHWLDEPFREHALAALRLLLRHLVKRHPVIVDALEWASCGMIAVAMLVGTLIANP